MSLYEQVIKRIFKSDWGSRIHAIGNDGQRLKVEFPGFKHFLEEFASIFASQDELVGRGYMELSLSQKEGATKGAFVVDATLPDGSHGSAIDVTHGAVNLGGPLTVTGATILNSLEVTSFDYEVAISNFNGLPGYNGSGTQVLGHVNGVLTWINVGTC